MLLRVILRRRQGLALVQVGQRRVKLLLLIVTALLIEAVKPEKRMLWWLARNRCLPLLASMAVTS